MTIRLLAHVECDHCGAEARAWLAHDELPRGWEHVEGIGDLCRACVPCVGLNRLVDDGTESVSAGTRGR